MNVSAEVPYVMLLTVFSGRFWITIMTETIRSLLTPDPTVCDHDSVVAHELVQGVAELAESNTIGVAARTFTMSGATRRSTNARTVTRAMDLPDFRPENIVQLPNLLHLALAIYGLSRDSFHKFSRLRRYYRPKHAPPQSKGTPPQWLSDFEAIRLDRFVQNYLVTSIKNWKRKNLSRKGKRPELPRALWLLKTVEFLSE